jgi:glycosyltransferase involved in cell wall biosynthesis
MVSDEFFKAYTVEEIKSVRSRMARILSDGKPIVDTIAIGSFLKNLGTWMQEQHPLVVSALDGQQLDLVSDQIHYLLQPTRIIDRKRIEKDWELIAALLKEPAFRKDFLDNPERKIVLHITGPAPIEHQADLESVLAAYQDVIGQEEENISNRLFMAFSIGTEYHPSFKDFSLEKLTIEDIYRLATAVVFPSQTEGRGLPIIESSAAGIPIICSRYHPEEIFAGVVGEHLPEDQQIRYVPFPEEEYSRPILEKISDFLLDPSQRRADNQHNIEVTRQRYSTSVMHNSFKAYLEALRLSK